MNTELFKILNRFSGRISVDSYKSLTGMYSILPFYHTVTDRPRPHFSELAFYRTEKRFLEDLKFFTEYYQSAPVSKYFSQKNAFHLTFDDGLSEIMTTVVPLLKEYGTDATFFINTDFIDNKKMFYRHKISLILNELRNSDAGTNLVSSYLDKSNSELFRFIESLTDEKEIDNIALKLNIDFKDYLNTEKPYLTVNQLHEIKRGGFTIGNHGQSHRNFNTLSFQEQKNEVLAVNAFLKKEQLAEELYFCFPFGDSAIKNEFFEWMYSEADISRSFGISGLKIDDFSNHHHRILMEYNDYSAEEIIKFEYFYYLLKIPLFKNRIKR